MSKHLQRDLGDLQRELLALAASVEEAIHKAIKALQNREIDPAQQVIEGDTQIDQEENHIEEECLKILALHQDLRPGDRLFWFSSTGWMMWNYIIGSLLVGATPVLFDGNPAHPDLNTLWQLAEKARMTVFGTSAAYLMNCLKAGIQPGQRFDLSALKCIGSTGSPLPPEGFAWAYANVKPDLWLASISGLSLKRMPTWAAAGSISFATIRSRSDWSGMVSGLAPPSTSSERHL